MKQLLLLALFSIATVGRAHGQIYYHDIAPDTILSATVAQGIARFDIDLDNDGTVDFYVKHFHPSAAQQDAEFYTQVGELGEVLVDGSDGPLALNQNDIIGPTQGTWVNRAGAMFSTALFMDANWSGKSDKYVGVRIKSGSQWLYGWVRMSVAADAASITVKDFAMSKTADKAIRAGQSSSAAVEPMGAVRPLSIFPNPANNTITISCKTGKDFRVLDLNGKQYAVAYAQYNETLTADISPLPQGTYLIRVNRQSGLFVKAQ